jgi:hypothetical protein
VGGVWVVMSFGSGRRGGGRVFMEGAQPMGCGGAAGHWAVTRRALPWHTLLRCAGMFQAGREGKEMDACALGNEGSASTRRERGRPRQKSTRMDWLRCCAIVIARRSLRVVPAVSPRAALLALLLSVSLTQRHVLNPLGAG